MKKIFAIVFVLFLSVAAYSQSANVISDSARLRATPTEKGKIKKILTKDTDVNVIRQEGAWFFVRASRTVGWLHRNSISFTPVVEEIRVDRLVNGGDGGVDSSAPLQIPSPAQTAPSRPRTVSGGVLNGKATSLPKPEYPPAARAIRAGGLVSVQILIDESGQVISADAVSGHPLLRAAAVQAAREARFSRTLLSGQPVNVSGVLVYNFAP